MPGGCTPLPLGPPAAPGASQAVQRRAPPAGRRSHRSARRYWSHNSHTRRLSGRARLNTALICPFSSLRFPFIEGFFYIFRSIQDSPPWKPLLAAASKQVSWVSYVTAVVITRPAAAYTPSDFLLALPPLPETGSESHKWVLATNCIYSSDSGTGRSSARSALLCSNQGFSLSVRSERAPWSSFPASGHLCLCNSSSDVEGLLPNSIQ